MCVCTGKCPGFSKMDIWDFINRVRIELPVEYGFIHPQLCEEDGDRFLMDFLKAHRKVVIGGCAPNMQNKLFRDAFNNSGLDISKDLVPLDVREEYMNRFKMMDVPEVIYCPFSILEETYENLPKDKPMIFADAAGLHSKEAVRFLTDKGFGDHIANMAGGLIEWERDELPLIIDKTEKLSGSCMCQLRPRNKKD